MSALPLAIQQRLCGLDFLVDALEEGGKRVEGGIWGNGSGWSVWVSGAVDE